MSADVSDLLPAAQTGDEQALLEVLRLCQPRLRRYADRLCDSDDVEEAVQDALWLLYRRVAALRTIGAFSAWLFKIVRRECLRRARRRYQFVEWNESEGLCLTQGGTADEDLRIDLTRAISSLPQHYREILILRDIGGFSSEEAAARLGIPVGAAKSRLHRARQLVRSCLQRTIKKQPRIRAVEGSQATCTSAAALSGFIS
jgi:RNA polymerase sigma factor (sigma-70 family)